jgi:predicted helicase
VVVRFITGAVHTLLRSKLGLSAGLADYRVRLLDPAAGPMNFVLAAWRQAIREQRSRGGDVEDLVRHHLVPHFRGVEVLPVMQARGERAVRRYLAALKIDVLKGAALGPLLGDALAGPLPPLDGPVPVVVGNPPWRGHSKNRGQWIDQLLHGYRLPDGSEDEGYYRVDGQPLGERNLKWLQDDWVKFLRVAQWTVDQAGQGIVGFVVPHTVLDAPTFSAVRRSLMVTFDEFYAVDLHGNQRKREKAPDGSRDENLFAGVAQGVAILVLVKTGSLWFLCRLFPLGFDVWRAAGRPER